MAHDTDTSPAPAPLDLPGSGDWLAWVTDRGRDELAEARRLVDELKAAPPAGTLAVLDRWNDTQVAIEHAQALSLWAEVHPDEAVRTRADEVGQEVQKLVTDLGLDRDLYAVFADLDEADLDADAARVLEHTLRDFRRAGVDRDEASRTRLRELSEQAVRLSQDFGRHIREDVRTVRLAPEQLDGLPDDYRAAHPAGDDGLVAITTDYPDLVPVHDLRGRRPGAPRAVPGRGQRRLAGQRPGAPGPPRRTPRDRDAAGLRLVARLRGRGEDDRHRRRGRRVHRPDQPAVPRPGRAGEVGAAGAQARRPARRRGGRVLRLALLLRARAPRAVRRRRPGRADLLRLRGGPTGPPRRHRPPLRPRVDSRPRRRGRHAGIPRWRRTTCAWTVGGSGASTSTCTHARASSSTPRSSTWSPGSASASCRRACSCATSPVA